VLFFEVVFIVFLLYRGKSLYRKVKYLITRDHYDLYGIEHRYRIRESELETFLENNFVYFQPLSNTARRKFIARVWSVYKRIEFVGYQELKLTDEIMISVIFAQVQLTFHLNSFYFDCFRRYILYPETFYSRFLDHDLKGLTTRNGFITFSWADFKHGYDVTHDKFNLGLHEMAHAFRIYKDLQQNTYNRTDFYMDVFDREAYDEIFLMQRDIPSVLRDYAKTNEEEFFAVCVEYFFEAPELLNAELPKIFKTMTKIFNQDPRNRMNDYVLE
jgi:hypothetical protein